MLRFLLLLAMFAPLYAEGLKFNPGLTIVLDLIDTVAAPAETLASMKAEILKDMQATGYSVDFKLREEITPEASFEDLIVVRLKGRCQMDNSPALLDERGPSALAYTHSSQGEILPFSEVLCDRLRGSIRAAMWGDDFKRGNFLLGRAIGRVLSHEFFHILGNTSGHGKDGLAKRTLSPNQLIAEQLRFEKADSNLLRLRARPAHTEAIHTDLP